MSSRIVADNAPDEGVRQPPPSGPGWRAWVAGQGEMGARVDAYPWSDTPLGPIEQWDPTLRTTVTLALSSLMPMTIWWGPDLVVIPNDAARQVFGDERFAAALGRPVAEVWPDTLPRIRSEMAELFRSGRPFFAPNSLAPFDRTVSLEECYLTYGYTPIVDAAARVVGVLCVFLESTVEVLAARRLRTLAELGAALGPLVSEDAWASAALEVLGGNSADHPAASIVRVEPGSPDAPTVLATRGEGLDAATVAALARECAATSTPQHAQASSPPVAGLHAYPLPDPRGDDAGHVLVVGHHRQRPWDDALAGYVALLAGTLTGALLAHGELWSERQRATQLAALDEAKSAFIAGVSHELRTPLALIAAPLEKVLDSEAGLSEGSRAALALARGNVDRLTTMVESLLDFSRLEAGRLLPHLETLDVGVLTAGLASSFAPAFERAGLEFVRDTPALSRPAALDRGFYERIMLNLLSNAAKYTPSGRVSLRLWEDGSCYRLEVADTGVGIAEADAERVFGRFERLPARAGVRSASGAGIGLAMVRELTHLLGGEVTLSPGPGGGSRFTVSLPFAPVALAGAPGQSVTARPVESFLAEVDAWAGPEPSPPDVALTVPAPPTQTAPRATDQGQPKLLVVEDDPDLARFLADSLADDYRVRTVPDGIAALAALTEDPPDIVLTDRSVPGIDGVELIRRLRASSDLRHLPVVLLSAHAGDEATSSGLRLGADDYVTKPFTMLDLRSRLTANLARARQRSADLAWRRAVIASMHDPVVIFDASGLVLELNESFTRLFGFHLEGGELRPPYPWWPTAAEDADGLAAIRARHQQATEGIGGLGEFSYRDRDRRPVWVSSADAVIPGVDAGQITVIRTFRDITRAKLAEARRVAAARVSDDFTAASDLETLLTVAEHGLELLFEGACTIQLDAGERYLFSSGRRIEPDQLDAAATAGLVGQPSADTVSLRPGILLVHRSGRADSRAWVQFPRPRPIGPDEMIVADLLAKGFSLAVDGLVAERRAAERQANLEKAVESHRMIGQAVGILVERHRLSPAQAFEKLARSSQHRNVKLREIALRVIESGADPDDA